jgi:hypothetical protein
MLGRRRLLAWFVVVGMPTTTQAVHAAPISTWAALKSAVKAATNNSNAYPLRKNTTLTLSQSFSMEGYDGWDSRIDLAGNGNVVTIVGNGATFDAKGKGGFFNVNSEVSATLIMSNVTMKNGYANDGQYPTGAIEISEGMVGGILYLDNCTFINNAAPWGASGALYFLMYCRAVIKGCLFVGPISAKHNDIVRYDATSEITFECGDNEIGTPVKISGFNSTEITEIPPKELQCKPRAV